jgi:serine/threonine protein phosphatase PrpC
MEIVTGVDAAWATSVGGRRENQDRCALAPGLAVVSDGVGGHAGGSRAAELTVDSVLRALAGLAVAPGEAELGAAVGRANAAVRAGRLADPTVASMGATVTVAAAQPADVVDPTEPGGGRPSRWLVAHVGDSPAWQVTAGGGARRLTRDHTLAAELVRTGALAAEAADTHPGRHMLLRAIGSEEHVAPDVVPVSLGPSDALVLASDGLSDVLDGPGIARVVAATATADEAARALVDAALAARTTDNVTTVVLRRLASSVHGQFAD